ncbi:tRNA (cmo5U34)-methyltransferase [endosymbiont of Ridgeia piscesae]|jgi:tRNA (cmo5U34)-methyltransferase|uniref:Carboxy-S-adenosyl-L-methionine synthase n=3 Tax=endosymbiont of Ridgeia piscesae TaxID=54398 RepID=A0A0T5YWI9_9GAMM|nr:carboxy-S-adenosyl-L-methionine synthase CmoA [endosymbiont of Ridgeia piscesae]KRT54967.1 tRNA (cmo5U34)-methyltransferase [endosymbiont of Ridgeia piscesae]
MPQDLSTDRLYAEPQQGSGDFVFDRQVAQVFPDMIKRSVPGYGTIINMIGTLAVSCVSEGSRCYDLGCSLAAAALAMRSGAAGRDCQVVAVDNSVAMLERAQELLSASEEGRDIELVCADLRDIEVRDASMVVLNFTLQFLPLDVREGLLRSIWQGMRPGGVLVLSEKIALEDPQSQALFVEMHHGFKRAQGYSELEISQKRSALENVLIPETLATHRMRLQQVGFERVEVWFQCFNFISLLAVK